MPLQITCTRVPPLGAASTHFHTANHRNGVYPLGVLTTCWVRSVSHFVITTVKLSIWM